MPHSVIADRFALVFGRSATLDELDVYRRARAQIELRRPPRLGPRPIIASRS